MIADKHELKQYMVRNDFDLREEGTLSGQILFKLDGTY